MTHKPGDIVSYDVFKYSVITKEETRFTLSEMKVIYDNYNRYHWIHVKYNEKNSNSPILISYD